MCCEQTLGCKVLGGLSGRPHVRSASRARVRQAKQSGASKAKAPPSHPPAHAAGEQSVTHRQQQLNSNTARRTGPTPGQTVRPFGTETWNV